MLIRLNERFKSLFKEYIAKQTIPYSYSGNGSGSYTPSYQLSPSRAAVPSTQVQKPTNHTIYFYEWSNLNNKSILFNNIELFKSFCNTHGIRINDYHEDMIKESSYVYCTCIPGTPTLMIRKHWKELNESLEAYKKSITLCNH